MTGEVWYFLEKVQVSVGTVHYQCQAYVPQKILTCDEIWIYHI